MNAEMIYNKFARYAESDGEYYTFGKHGLIEDVLAWFNLPSDKFIGASSAVHANNLEKLHKYMITNATEDQLKMVERICDGRISLPQIDNSDATAGLVFVSMPMNKDKCTCVDEIRNGISMGLEKAGWKPYFLDKDTHNDNIYNVMLAHIFNCKFLVADLTSQNPGVYYEAGYAKALGKTVIFTCKDTDFDKRHFDIRQVQTLSWNNSLDLQEKLSQHIQTMQIK